MPQQTIKLTGWQAIIGLVVIIAVLGMRLATLGDQIDDSNLVQDLEQRLIAEYFPDDVQRLREAFESGNDKNLSDVAGSVTSTKLNLDSIQGSYPLFNFSSTKMVVVKVSYSLNDASGTREKGTHYYLYNHGSLMGTWQYQRNSTVVSYYLNFM